MGGYLSIVKISDSILDSLEKLGDINVDETELFKPLAGHVDSHSFEVVLGWMQKQGVVERNEAIGCWSVSLTDRGLEQRRARLAGRKA